MTGPQRVALFLSFVVGAVLRTSYAFRGGLWRDEAQSVGIVEIPSLHGMIEFLKLHESHPPGYYLLIRGWGYLFGTSDSSVLIPSLLFSIGLIPIAFLVARKLHSPEAGVLTAALISVHPGLIKYGATARPYSLLSLLSILLLALLWTILERGPSRNRILGYALVTSLMVYVHHWSWLVVAAGGAMWTALGLRRRGTAELRPIIIAHLGIALIYSPWVHAFLLQLRGAGHLPANTSTLEASLGAVAHVVWLHPLPALVLTALAIRLFSTRDGSRSPEGEGLLVGLAGGIAGIAALLTVVLLPLANLTSMWCYSIVTPPFLVALGVMLSHAGTGARRRTVALARAAWVGLLLAVGLPLMSTPRSNVRESSAFIGEHLNRADRILVVPGYLVPSVWRYLGPSERATSVPEDTLAPYIVYDHRGDLDLQENAWKRAISVIDSAKTDCTRLWVIAEAAYIPEHMIPQVRQLLAHAESRLGPPTMKRIPELGAGVLERALVQRYDPCPVSGARLADPPDEGRR